MDPLAITGLGVVSPIGVGRAAFVEALRVPGLAIERAFQGTPTVFDPEKLPDARAAEVWGFDAKQHLGAKGLRNFDRLTKFLIVAGKHALEDAGLKVRGEFQAYGPADVGVCSSTAYGSLDAITELNLVAELEDPRYINPARFPNTVINAAAGYVSIWEDLRAPNVTVVDGNCGALDAVLTGATHLAHRRGAAFLVGGGEVLSEPLYLAFRKLGLVSEPASEGTANAEYGGMQLGEGAAYVCLERVDGARERGARVLANVLGYGMAFDPPESEALVVHASAASVERAIVSALKDAGVAPDQVDVVCAAASGLLPFDVAERQGIAAALGDQVPVAAPKAIYGETFGAGGALAMATVLAWLDGTPPAPLVAGQAPSSVRTVVATAVGFYGNVSAVVIRRA